MGTRSLTFVYDNHNDKAVLCMYRQMDGYPSGHGSDLAEFLSSGEMVNGFNPGETKVFNGMSCLAAQMVAEFKNGPGGIYLLPTDTEDADQDYEYHIRYFNRFSIEVTDGEDTLFLGTLSDFTEFCKNSED